MGSGHDELTGIEAIIWFPPRPPPPPPSTPIPPLPHTPCESTLKNRGKKIIWIYSEHWYYYNWTKHYEIMCKFYGIYSYLLHN